MTHETLVHNLMTTAVCNTSHPADAASALMLAAGELLHAKLGSVASLAVLRSIVDDAERALIAANGRQTGETVQ